jgi:hypothetical protein
MALHSALPYLESILPPSLRAKLNSATTNPWSEPDPGIAAAIPFVNGATGELMAKIPMPSPKRVIRGKLRDLLRTDVEVRFGRRLTDIRVDDDGVVAVFDGEEVRGSVLVGADGGRLSSFQLADAYGVKCGVWCEGISSTRRLRRCRSRISWFWLVFCLYPLVGSR